MGANEMTVQEYWLPEYVSETGEVYPATQISAVYKERELDCGCIASYLMTPAPSLSQAADPAYLSQLERLLDVGLDRQAETHLCKPKDANQEMGQ